jgi:hypothetical protein
VPTKIDWRMTAGQGFAPAKVMLGQFARADGRPDEALALLRAAAVGALDPKSGDIFADLSASLNWTLKMAAGTSVTVGAKYSAS